MKGEIELNLASDIRIKAWLNCFDCPDVTKPIGAFWNEFIEYKLFKILEQKHQQIINIY